MGSDKVVKFPTQKELPDGYRQSAKELARYILEVSRTVKKLDIDWFESKGASHLADTYYGTSAYQLVADSASDPMSYDACVLLFERILRERESMPPALAAFAVDVMRGKLSRPSVRGPNPFKNYQRNLHIRVTLTILSEAFPTIPAYDAYDNGSINACAIVSECLVELEMEYLGADAIKKIWLTKGGPVPPPDVAGKV